MGTVPPDFLFACLLDPPDPWVDLALVPLLFFAISDLRFLDVLILDSCLNSVIVIGRSLDLLIDDVLGLDLQ